MKISKLIFIIEFNQLKSYMFSTIINIKLLLLKTQWCNYPIDTSISPILLCKDINVY